ncbi:MAG: hypothetical protein JWM43_2679 [Acidobacteriaceae bacterium]|nr:hypothetical protein [Acidobacteriaceae bacterium]
MTTQPDLNLGKYVDRTKDIFLCHNGANKPWVEALAEHLESVPHDNRYLGVVFDKWDFDKGKNVVLELEKYIDEARFVGIVVSKAMLEAEWPTLERTIAVWSDPSGRKGRVVTLLLENVELPASLRVRNWIDFRDPSKYEEGFTELVGLLTGLPKRRGRGGFTPSIPATSLGYVASPQVIAASSGADRVDELLITNLLPVTELPQIVQSATTTMRKKSDVKQFTESKAIPPFILREGKLYTFSDLHDINNSLGTAVDLKSLKDVELRSWFSSEAKRRWGIELLNLVLRKHCWDRYLTLDREGQRFFFRPNKGQPKQITWYLNGKRVREVTTQHFGMRKGEDGKPVKFPFGWRHQAIRAEFVYLPMGLFLRITPTYMLTKEDGKTPRGGSRVGPILSQWLNQERNGQILRSLRFWALVLTRGDKEALSIETGNERVRVSLNPASGNMSFGILGDSIDYERLVNAEYEDDLAVPDLAPFQFSMLFGETE